MGHFSVAEALLQHWTQPLNCATRFTFPSLLKACASYSHLRYGQTIHALVLIKGLFSDPFIASSLISMYAKCGSVSMVSQVFEAFLHPPDSTVWNSTLDAYFLFGLFREGSHLFRRMQHEGCAPDAYSLCIMINQRLLYKETQQLHAWILKNNFNDNAYLRTSLITSYFNHSKPLKAWNVFLSAIIQDGIVAWNAMIQGLTSNGFWLAGLNIYVSLRAEGLLPVTPTIVSTLTACSQAQNGLFGEQVHCDIVKMGFANDPYIGTSLLIMYAKCRSIEAAEIVFESVARKSPELWNALLSAYAGSGSPYKTLEAYKWMRSHEIFPDSIALSTVLACCCVACSYAFGRSLHAEIIKFSLQNNIHVQSSLLTMYSTFNNTEDALLVFRNMNKPDTVAWGSMISGLCHNEKHKEAFDLFGEMAESDVVIDGDVLATLSTACSGKEGLSSGCSIHGWVAKSGWQADVVVSTSLIDMYSRCCSPSMAEQVFALMSSKNLVTWNSIISCYSKNGLPLMSISAFSDFICQGWKPALTTFTSVLVAISTTAMMLYGKMVHACLIRSEISLDTEVQNALIDMYAKCGLLDYAESILKSMHQRTLITMNIMIAAYGSHGESCKAMNLFDEMRSLGITPDGVTFLHLLSSCNHSGMTETGLRLFESMQHDDGIEPTREHYAVVIDLLGRAGRVDDAVKVVQGMTVKPDASIWLSLLRSSRAHRRLEIGRMAAEEVQKMEPWSSGGTAQSLAYYREANLWERSASILASTRVKKPAGCSWIEVRNRVHTFVSGQCSAPRIADVYETLESLTTTMREERRRRILL